VRNGRPVDRISAQVDRLRLDKHADRAGRFGFLEADDDAVVFERLLDTACDWLSGQGMTRVLGPFNFSNNDECGLLVEASIRHPASCWVSHWPIP